MQRNNSKTPLVCYKRQKKQFQEVLLRLGRRATTMATAASWRTTSYLLTPDASANAAGQLYSAPMRQTEPRFLAAYFDASGPGPRYNSPDDRTAFPKPYLSQHSTFGRSDRFSYVDAFSANRGVPDRASPGPGRYPATPSVFDKYNRSAQLRPGMLSLAFGTAKWPARALIHLQCDICDFRALLTCCAPPFPPLFLHGQSTVRQQNIGYRMSSQLKQRDADTWLCFNTSTQLTLPDTTRIGEKAWVSVLPSGERCRPGLSLLEAARRRSAVPGPLPLKKHDPAGPRNTRQAPWRTGRSGSGLIVRVYKTASFYEAA